MKHWKRLLIPATVLCIMTPAALWAQEGVPEVAEPDAMENIQSSFQNPTQAEKAGNLAGAWTSDDGEIADQLANEYAEDKVASDYADAVVEEITTDYAKKVVAEAYAQDFVETKAHDYAITFGDETTEAYKEKYAEALARGTGGGEDWVDARQTAFEAEFARMSDPDYPVFNQVMYDEALSYAEQRATGGGEDWVDARQTAYNHALEGIQNGEFSEEMKEAYEKVMEQALADVFNYKVEYVSHLRLVDGYGWGVIARKHLGVHPSNLGMKRGWKKGLPALGDEVAPPEPQLLSLDEEIAEMTRRNTRTGWNEEPGYKAKNKNGSNKKYGLAQTSGAVTSDVKGNKGGNKSKKSKSAQTVTSSSRDDRGGSSAAAKSNNGRGNSGGSNSNKSSNGNDGNNGNSGNSGNNGNNGNSGNNGNNGNNGGGNGNKGGKK